MDVAKQFLKFCLVGLTSTTLTYLIYIITLNFLSFEYIYSYIFSVIPGILFAFYFNKSFSFGYKEKFQRSFFIYVLIYVFSLTSGGFLLRVLIEQGGLPPIFAIIPVFAYTTTVDFLGIKVFAFKNRKW